MIHVLMISGGKDSAALWAWAKRTGLSPRIQLAQDTGWEANFEGARWEEYLTALEEHFREPLRIVAAETQFKERVLKHNTFPGRLNRRWCSQELKIEPARTVLDAIREETGDDVTVVVGVRAEESADRAELPEREWSDFYDAEVWRPLLTWTLADVLAEHHRTGVPLNPLYRMGAERVGCWPCIKAGKREIRMVAERDPGRIQDIRELEQKTGTTMFCLERPVKNKSPRKLLPTPIDDMIKWSKTARGGLQIAMYPEPSGCARWGICDLPKDDAPHPTPTPGPAKGGRP